MVLFPNFFILGQFIVYLTSLATYPLLMPVCSTPGWRTLCHLCFCILLCTASIQAVAQSKLHLPFELTTVKGNSLGSWGVTIESMIDVDKSFSFGAKLYTFAMDPGYSYSGDEPLKARYVGGYLGYTFYFTPTIALQLASDFRKFRKVDDGFTQIGNYVLKADVPDGLDADFGAIITTRWLIIPFPQFMKVGLGARYIGALSQRPMTLRLVDGTTAEVHQITNKGLFFTVNAAFMFNLSKKKNP